MESQVAVCKTLVTSLIMGTIMKIQQIGINTREEVHKLPEIVTHTRDTARTELSCVHSTVWMKQKRGKKN